MADWKNRIVGTGAEDPRKIVANPRNWRIHPMAQSKALEGVLGEIGWIAPVTINRTTGFCLDGHLRVALAVKNKAATVPVQYVELSEDEEAVALATLDPISALAEADVGVLTTLLQSVKTGDAAVQQMLADLLEEAQKAHPDPLDLGEGENEAGAEDEKEELSCPKCGFTFYV